MKKVLLSLAVIAGASSVNAQVSCKGVSPASIAGPYEFTWADPAGGDWTTPDYLLPGLYVEDTLMLVDDGSTGTNAQGNPVAQEGCNPLVNDLTGKIAVIYRNTCEFGLKALNAQNAGAVGVIIINRDNEVIGMGGGASGTSVNIPVFMLSSADGAIITAAMQQGPVVMFLGNKIGVNADDVGIDPALALISPYGAQHDALFDGFDVGVQFVNYGSAVQNSVTVNANIDGPGGNVYDETIGPFTMNQLDTIGAFPGFTNSFPAFNLGGVGNYPAGEYTLTYTVSLGTTDGDPVDNVYESKFTVNGNVISRANLDTNGKPLHNSYPTNTDLQYQSCMYYQDDNAGILGVDGLWFVPYTDTAANALAGEEILVNVYEWDDPWVDLDDNLFTTQNGAFQSLTPIAFNNYIVASDNETKTAVFAPFESFALNGLQRYLFCVQTFTPYVGFGYDRTLNYDGNINVTRMPVGPILTEDAANTPTTTWFSGGWVSANAPSIAISTIPVNQVGIDEAGALEGTVYPNPTNGEVIIELSSNEDATLVVTDMAGKVVATTALSFNSGAANFSTDGFEAGMYLFNVTLENGQTAQFTVVKK